jgi:hypothetical protein
MRQNRKVAQNTRPEGQPQGQLGAVAAELGVSEEWLRLIACGTVAELGDPVFVAAIRDAAKTPALWACVSPVAREALELSVVKAESLGHSLDDVLLHLMETIERLRDPENRDFASHHTALDHLNNMLDLAFQVRNDEEAERGRKTNAGSDNGNIKKRSDADAKARPWHEEVKARTSGPASTIHRKIAKRLLKKGRRKITGAAIEKKADAVKKAIAGFRKRHPSEK